MKIYLVGHIGPDLDAAVAPIAYADYLEKSKRYEGSNIVPVLAGEPNVETKFVLDKFGVTTPALLDDIEIDSTDAFILVDHNEESQRHPKVVAEQVIEIIDHHKINISFTSPLRIDVRPYGSTSTIVYRNFEMYGLKPSKQSLELILAAILSDTIGLKSSLTTGLDSKIAKDIAEELDLDVEKFTFELFKSKSDITGLTTEEIIKKDYKVFDFSGKKTFIGVIETVEPQKIIEQKEEIVNGLSEVKANEGASFGFFVVIDILNMNSQLLYQTNEEKEIAEKAFTAEAENGVIDIGPRTSRKKDIAPAIEIALG